MSHRSPYLPLHRYAIEPGTNKSSMPHQKSSLPNDSSPRELAMVQRAPSPAFTESKKLRQRPGLELRDVRAGGFVRSFNTQVHPVRSSLLRKSYLRRIFPAVHSRLWEAIVRIQFFPRKRSCGAKCLLRAPRQVNRWEVWSRFAAFQTLLWAIRVRPPELCSVAQNSDD